MQASRASSRAFRAIAASSGQARSLHVTGSATFSNLLNSERRALNFPQDIAGLQAECTKRKLPTVGSENELLNRLTAHEMASSRAFSTANSKRPTPSSSGTGTSSRHFNTSRSLKAVGDTSTIDFSFIPEFDPSLSSTPIVRVPILPQTIPTEEAKTHTAADGEEEVMLPTVDAPTVLRGAGEELQGFATTFAKSLRAPSDPNNPSMAREIFGGMWEDILSIGSKDQGKPKA